MLIAIDTTGKSISLLNPFRYHRYIYDAETRLYYVSSRYYDPEVGRFANADDIEAIAADFDNLAQYNLFTYCWNNPVNMRDKIGTWPEWIKKAATVVAAAAAVVAATAITVATCGAGSVAGVAMITATATLAARTTEVAVLQTKKGINEGKSGEQIAKDCFEAVYDNGGTIIGKTPYIKMGVVAAKQLMVSSAADYVVGGHSLGEIINTPVGKQTLGTILKIPVGKQTLSATLRMRSGKGAYIFAAGAWTQTVISIFSEDPIQRAANRGYVLK